MACRICTTIQDLGNTKCQNKFIQIFQISVKYWIESGKNVFKRLQKAGVKNERKYF